ncbi:MAG: cobalt ECF transporter T component CbiQ [Deltaproteobacteria bacterium]|nr:cobalt ECF transporter T component CbiQ [Deltaproteobacteria bacterium]
MKEILPSFLTVKSPPEPEEKTAGRRLRRSFVHQGLAYAAAILRTGFSQWETSSKRGFFQGLDSRVKVLFLVFFMVIVSIQYTLISQAATAFFLLGLAVSSRLALGKHYGRILLLTFIFGFLTTWPAAFNIFSPGDILWPVFRFEKDPTWGPITVPREIGLTYEGLRRTALLSLRVMNSLSISLLVFATTPFTEFIKALKVFRVPDVFLLTITLSYKYIFIFVQTVYDMHIAKKSRLVGAESGRAARHWVSGRLAFMFHKSQQQCEEVFKAMTVRGLADTVKLRRLPPLATKNWGFGAGLLVSGLLLVLL